MVGLMPTRPYIRYEVLKEARGKCQLCGIASEVRPIDVDHIIPRSKADKNGKVRLNGQLIHVHDRQNLQALCFSCNRAKRDGDQTDFRRREKLVRDRIPEIIKGLGRSPKVAELKGQELRAALYEKLIEEHAEFLHAKSISEKLEELADLIEVALAIGAQFGADKRHMLSLVKEKRTERRGFSRGYLYMGDL